MDDLDFIPGIGGKIGFTGFQGLKPLKTTQTQCRAYLFLRQDEKARPTKLTSCSATCKAATNKNLLQDCFYLP
jgi:hypothetical protein